MTPKERFQQSLAELKIDLADDVIDKLMKYLDLVLEANKTMNLTSIEDPSEAVSKHLVDSLSALMLKSLEPQLGVQSHWLDVGSGAGFPGMALAVACPEAQVTLLESTGKKAHFLETTAAQLGLMKRVQVYNARAEAVCLPGPGARSAKAEAVPRGTGPVVPTLRNSQNVIFFRGVSKLASLIELAMPLLKEGGIMVAYKGPKADEEIVEAKKAMAQLKAEVVEKKAFNLPITNDARVLLVLRKVGETSKFYPRAVGLAQKEPIL